MFYIEETSNRRYIMLHEVDTAKELEAMRAARPDHDFTVISATRAHRYVKDGLTHNTALWIDQGRIRRASANY